MTKLNLICFILMLVIACPLSHGQTITDDDEEDFAYAESLNKKFKAVGIDIFPLINSIFSDDGSSSLFQINYIWGKGRSHNEFGFAPQFSYIKSDSDISNQTIVGAGLEFYGGNRFDIGEKWRGVWGVLVNYRLSFQKNNTSQNNEAKIRTETHVGGLGPQFIFGYQFSEKILLRSRIAGLLQYQNASTKINDGPFNAGKQSISTVDFRFTSPKVLELVLFF